MMRRASLFAVYGCALAAAVAPGHLQMAARAAEPATAAVTPLPPAVTVARARTADFVETVLVTGSLAPREEVLVGPEVEGLRLIEVLAEEGDRVKEGQILARMVRDTLDAQLAANAAALARTTAAIAQAGSQITQAEAALAEARNNFDRARSLRGTGALTEQTYDQREAAARTGEARLLAARDGLKFAEAEKAQVEAQRRELDWKMLRTEIRAPADGLVSRRTARIGGMVAGAGEPLFRIIAKGEVELDAEVTEVRMGRLKAGQSVRVDVAGLGEVRGEVRLVAPEVDRATRLGRVRIFLGDDARLRVGTFGRGRIETAKSRGIAVPASAVLYNDAGAFVQTVADGKVTSRAVRTGLADGSLVEIRDGLAEGDVVVARAGTLLRDGDLVRPVEPTRAAKTAERH